MPLRAGAVPVQATRAAFQFYLSDHSFIGEWAKAEAGNGGAEKCSDRCIHGRGKMERGGIVHIIHYCITHERCRSQQTYFSCKVLNLSAGIFCFNAFA